MNINISPSPAPSPETERQHQPFQPRTPAPVSPELRTHSKLPFQFSPPLIAMVLIIATAFVIITNSRAISRVLLKLSRRWRQWRRRRRLMRSYVPSSLGDIESPPYDPSDGYQLFSPYGLEESVIKTIPLSIHSRKSSVNECAVCLLEFEIDDYVRTLPICNHSFHIDCIDIWLRSHANCPLCRAGVFRPEPVMSPRIRPSLDDVVMESTIMEEIEVENEEETQPANEITDETSPRNAETEDREDRRNFLLKRSYSFGFERNLGSERLVMEPSTASPWRYRRSFWSKRPSPFSSVTKPRVFSFRYYKGINIKSPFFRRRSGGGLFFPLSESSARYGGGGGGGGSSSRRSKSFASPMFVRQSVTFSSSRLRSGDPEALLSPDRYNRRWR